MVESMSESGKNKQNKILFFQWNAFMQKGMERALKELSMEYEIYEYHFENWDHDDKFYQQFLTFLKNRPEFSSVLTVNFFPVISDVCEQLQIPYISWVYDAPVHIRRTETMKNSCNRIWFFDRVQAEQYQAQGVEHAYHLPLAVDSSVFSECAGIDCNPIDIPTYDCDVSMVGKLYQSDFAYLCGPLDRYWRGYLDGIVAAQMRVQFGYVIGEMIDEKLMDQLNAYYRKASKGTFQVKKEELEYTLACEVTSRTRMMALSLLQSRCNVDLYGNDQNDFLDQVNMKGYADYYTQMPRAFHNSKINLNLSLRIIQSGIPLRVLDVLGCGGFLITNYQPEILEYFEPGVDLVVYEGLKDLVAKVDYYLKHGEERIAIARNGYQKVQKLFSFEERLRTMFDQLNEK